MEHYFEFNHPNSLVGKYVSKLRASKMSESSSIIRISITGDNRGQRMLDF